MPGVRGSQQRGGYRPGASGTRSYPQGRQGLVNWRELAGGLKYTPMDLAGFPMDVIGAATNLMLPTPPGYEGIQPKVPFGSEYLIDRAVNQGLVSQPIGSSSENAGRFLAGLASPVGLPRAALGAGKLVGKGINSLQTGRSFAPGSRGAQRGSVGFPPDKPEIKNPLVGLHNTTPDKLSKMDALGGFPVPSMAVSRADYPLSGFGDISLLTSPQMVTPGRGNPFFDADVYSPRFPSIQTRLGDADSEKLMQYLNPDNRFGELYRPLRDEKGGSYATPSGAHDSIDSSGIGALSRELSVKYQFLKEKGVAPKIEGDSWDFRRSVLQALKPFDSEFYAWSEGIPERLGLTPEQRIFKGFTPMGRRRYSPLTLESATKEMKGGVRGGEGFGYGPGSIRSSVAKQYRSLASMKKDRNRIITPDEMKPIKEEFDRDLGNLAEKMNASPDNLATNLEEAGTKGVGVLREYYPDISQDQMQEASRYLEKLRTAPTEYFEGKPQRSVQLNEFAGAAVPENTPQETLDLLEKAGLRIEMYKSPADRAAAIKRFKDLLFGIGAVGSPLGMSFLQNEQRQGGM